MNCRCSRILKHVPAWLEHVATWTCRACSDNRDQPDTRFASKGKWNNREQAAVIAPQNQAWYPGVVTGGKK